MHSYFRRHTLRTKSSSNPTPSKQFVRRTRYDNRNDSIREESYSRRGPSPRRPPFSISRAREYDEEQYDIDRTEAPVVQTRLRTPESSYRPPNILTEKQRALWLSYYPDCEINERLEPNTNNAITKTHDDDDNDDDDDDQSQQED